MLKIAAIALATCAFVVPNAVAQALECSSAPLVQQLQQDLQHKFAPPAINSIEAIARGQQPASVSVQIISIDTASPTPSLQKCSATARILRSDLPRPINVTAQYTIYNHSTAGEFDVVVSP